jgi:murein L,D-transpeptidase YafK
MEIKIYKTKKILEIWEDGKLHQQFPIAIGKSEIGHKQREGDMKTPEGEYHICHHFEDTPYFRSVLLNYPNNLDAQHGLQEKAITLSEYEEICEANNKGAVPLQKTALGGEICIHGELEKRDWSHGCVRMYNKDITSLYDDLRLGTKVTIFP